MPSSYHCGTLKFNKNKFKQIVFEICKNLAASAFFLLILYFRQISIIICNSPALNKTLL